MAGWSALALVCLVPTAPVLASLSHDPPAPIGEAEPAAQPARAVRASPPTSESATRPSVVDSSPEPLNPANPNWKQPSSRVDRLVLVGDSLAQEVAPNLQFLTAPKEFVPKYWGGTAPCDWTSVDLEADRSTVVVITFTGNTLTPCMEDGVGGHLIDEALVEQYRRDIEVLIDTARRAGARVVLIGQPLRAASFDADVEVNGINEIYRAFAARSSYVSFYDAGAAVEAADGTFTERLPCSTYDIDCASDGTTVVRGDGVHFCPTAGKNPCPVWSGGAFRFALGIAEAVDHSARYD